MASYTPLRLPYYAPSETLPAPLPQIEEIEALVRARTEEHTACIARKDTTAGDGSCEDEDEHREHEEMREDVEYAIKFFRDGTRLVMDPYVVHYGREVDVVEAESMIYVRENTDLRVPTVFAVFEHDDNNNGEKKTCIITERVRGTRLTDLERRRRRRGDSDPDTDRVVEKAKAAFRRALETLRNIPSPGYYGKLGRRPFGSAKDPGQDHSTPSTSSTPRTARAGVAAAGTPSATTTTTAASPTTRWRRGRSSCGSFSTCALRLPSSRSTADPSSAPTSSCAPCFSKKGPTTSSSASRIGRMRASCPLTWSMDEMPDPVVSGTATSLPRSRLSSRGWTAPCAGAHRTGIYTFLTNELVLILRRRTAVVCRI
ncbi:hypothetical protein F5Y17DRAFT_21714 [Xylariaceae sp. FL0594]|nr:hypothetical protein F5Y17DRAFT_21714 [Xylariaceae sp. FL0594]